MAACAASTQPDPSHTTPIRREAGPVGELSEHPSARTSDAGDPADAKPPSPANAAPAATPDAARAPAHDADPPAAIDAARPAIAPVANPWPEAAGRFLKTGPWTGADSAYSIDLGQGRVLWLFADTFVDPNRDGSRTNGPNFFIRNSVAIQTSEPGAPAYDLARARFAFYWGQGADKNPASFFPESTDGRWIWPLHGALMPDGKLLLFRMWCIKVEGGFGFEVTGWDAIAIDQPSAEPSAWTWRVIAGTPDGAKQLLGASVLRYGDHLYAYVSNNAPGDHGIYLTRWPIAALAGLPERVLDDPEWFTRAGRYQRQSAGGEAAVLIKNGQVEFSVHFEPRLNQFVQVQMAGLFLADPETQIVLRTASQPHGPWSAPVRLFRPRAAVSDLSKFIAYAAKAHPEQRGADMVLTYVINELETLAPNDAVYYPEPVRVELDGKP